MSGTGCSAPAARWTLEIEALVNYRDYHATTRGDGWQMRVGDGGARAPRRRLRRRAPCLVLAEGAEAQPAHAWYRRLPAGRGARRVASTPTTTTCTPGPSALHLEPRSRSDRRPVQRAGALARRRGRVARAASSRGGPAGAVGARRARRGGGARLDPPARAGRRPVRRAPPVGRRPRRHVGHRRLPLVRGLGPRHDDRAARARARHRPPRDRPRASCRTFARFVDRGMLPNRFPDAGEAPEYNTVDATLWYFEAIRAYHAATDDDTLLKELFPVLEEHRRLAPARHPLRHRRGPGRRAPPRGRARRPAHLDGRQGRRLGGDTAHRQAGRDQRPLVQRAARDGRLRPPARTARRPVGNARLAGAGRVRPLLERDGRLLLRRHRRPDGARRRAPAEPDPRRVAGGEPPRARAAAAGGRRLRAPSPDLVRTPQPRARAPAVPRGLLRGSKGARRASTTRGRSGPGCSAPSCSRTCASTATRRRPARFSSRWRTTSTTSAWAASPRSSTATPPSTRAAASPRRGACRDAAGVGGDRARASRAASTGSRSGPRVTAERSLDSAPRDAPPPGACPKPSHRESRSSRISRTLSGNDRPPSRCLHRSDKRRASCMVSMPAVRSRISLTSCWSERPLKRARFFRRRMVFGSRPRTRIEGTLFFSTLRSNPFAAGGLDRGSPNHACSSQASPSGCHLVAIRSASATDFGTYGHGERLGMPLNAVLPGRSRP